MMKLSGVVERSTAVLRRELSDLNREWTMSGQFGASYPALLVETFHYVKCSVPLMASALGRIRNDRVQEYLSRHIGEECGHEQWAVEDLMALGYDPSEVKRSVPLPETIRLIGSQHYVIEYLSPVGLMGYVYVMESMPPRRALLDAVGDAYKLSGALKFLYGHGEADQVHMKEIRDILDLIDDPVDASAAVTSAVLGIQCMVSLCQRLRRGDFVENELSSVSGVGKN